MPKLTVLDIRIMIPDLSTVRARRAEITRQAKLLSEEDKELEIAERALMRLAAAMPAPSQPQSADAVEIPQGAAITAPVTQESLVVATLAASAEPWFETAAALRHEIARTHRVHIKNSSFQPLVSLLKRKNIIARDGQRIALAARLAHESNTPPATTGGAFDLPNQGG